MAVTADLWNAALHNAGFTGTVPDMKKQWLEGVGGTNPQIGDTLYLSGNENTVGSIRFIVNDSGFAEVQKQTDPGLWQAASFMTGSATLWVGHNVGLAAMGKHMAIENADGNMHFYAHSEFDLTTGMSTGQASMLNAYQHMVSYPFQIDDSGDWQGTSFDHVRVGTMHTLHHAVTFKFGATVPTTPISVRVYKGGSDTDPMIFKYTFPITGALPNDYFKFDLPGHLEFEKGTTYLIRYTSDEVFSLKTNAAVTEPYFHSDFSLVRDEGMFQTPSYVDGDMYSNGQWMVHDRKIYACNTTGIQTGTFTSNAAKWDILGTGSISSLHWSETAGNLQNVTGPTSMKFNDTTRDRFVVDNTGTLLTSPDGTTVVDVSNAGTSITGNVGIGIVTPSTRLDIDGSINPGGDSLRLRSGDNTDPADSNQIVLSYNGGVNYSHAIKSRHSSGTGFGNAIDFYVWNQGVDLSTDVGTLHTMSLENGKVGIGVTNPDTKLQVAGDIKTDTGIIKTGANTFEIAHESYADPVLEGDFLADTAQFHTRLGVGSPPDQAMLEVHSASITTDNILQVSGTSLTTGNVAAFHSGSDSTLNRELVHIHNSSALATGVTVLGLTQDSTGLALDCDGDAYFQKDVAIDGVFSVKDGEIVATGAMAAISSPNGTHVVLADNNRVDITATTLFNVNDNTRDRMIIDNIDTKIVSPNGVKTLEVSNTVVRVVENTVHRLDIDGGDSILRSPDGSKHVGVSNLRGTEMSGPLVVADTYVFLGDVDTDGSWRFRVVGAQLVFDRREAGAWVQKSTMG